MKFPEGFDYVKQDLDHFGVWEPRTTEYIKSHLKKGQTFLDVGAQVGYFTVLASELGAKVYAFEPSSVNRECLIENIKENGCKDITVVDKALSNTNGIARLFTGKTPGENSLMENYHKGKGFEEVETIRFDDWNKEARII
jgi:FkbM family methyltransferase